MAVTSFVAGLASVLGLESRGRGLAAVCDAVDDARLGCVEDASCSGLVAVSADSGLAGAEAGLLALFSVLPKAAALEGATDVPVFAVNSSAATPAGGAAANCD